VEVEAEEAQHLIATGFAVDPDAPAAGAATVVQDGRDPRLVRIPGWDQGASPLVR
jgi:hypothetical protein